MGYSEFLWKPNDGPFLPAIFNTAQFSSDLEENGCLVVWNSLMATNEASKVSLALYPVLALSPWTNDIWTLSVHLFIQRSAK